MQSLTPGELSLQLLKDLERADIKAVYLRNHEDLPVSVGNDVDLLIQQGKTKEALARITEISINYGWRVLRHVHFSPVSIFLVSDDFEHFLHVDLFDRLEWHFIEYADAESMIEKRQWNGQVHPPDPSDELFLNISTRLIYQGTIRDKHRVQTGKFLGQGLHEEIQDAFIRHLGTGLGSALGDAVVREDWSAAESFKVALRRKAIVRYGLRSPYSALTGIWRYLTRSLQRAINPPGPFIVFEGADGVGKSTIIEGLIPLFKDLTGRTDTLLFHWKPTRASIRQAGDVPGPASNPRGKPCRSMALSIVFLMYHWLGFWKCYLHNIWMARVKNRAVLADRYAYEFFLDPARLRMKLPVWLARVAATTVPIPDIVLCFVAAPQKVVARKPELRIDEITIYQNKLQAMTLNNPRCILVHANGNVDEVLAQVRSLISEKLFKK